MNAPDVLDSAQKSKSSEKDLRWNRFVWEICERDAALLSPVQKNAVLCFWYYSEMSSGGHSAYFDSSAKAKTTELLRAILAVANKRIAFNYLLAVSVDRITGWMLTDLLFDMFSSSFFECLAAYVERHKDDIFV